MKRPKVNRFLVAVAITYICFVAAVAGEQLVRYLKQPTVARS